MLKFIKNCFRIIYIAYVFLKNRKNIAKSLEELGPAFIKLGQFLSTRPDLIGYEMAKSFDYLRDQLPSFSFYEASKIIANEFGKNIDELFNKFEKEPIAAASIAQVHKAITKDGKTVAVKVRRPNIDKIMLREIDFFYFIANSLNKFFPKYKRLKLKEVVKTIETSFRFELDLSFEAAAASELREKNQLDYVYIPEVDWSLTSNKVFTMEWVDAISIYEKDTLSRQGIDLAKLAKNFAIMFCAQAFDKGFFHADLHQGNILVTKEGKIALLDFGIMGRLDYHNRIYVAQILYGFLNRDYALIAQLHHQAGYVHSKYSAALFAQSCRAIGEPIMNLAPEQISIAKLLAQLFKVTEDFQMETQPQLLLLQKTMIMVEGIGKILCPEQNLWFLAEEWLKSWAQENISLHAKALKLAKRILKKILLH